MKEENGGYILVGRGIFDSMPLFLGTNSDIMLYSFLSHYLPSSIMIIMTGGSVLFGSLFRPPSHFLL